jgi:sialic acid synthase SpsE
MSWFPMWKILAANYNNQTTNELVSGIYIAAILSTAACTLEPLDRAVSWHCNREPEQSPLITCIANVDLIINECQKFVETVNLLSSTY